MKNRDWFYVYEVMGIDLINHTTFRLATFSSKRMAKKWAEEWKEHWETTWIVEQCVFKRKPF